MPLHTHNLASLRRQCFPVADGMLSSSSSRAPEILLETKRVLRATFPVAADFSSRDGSAFLPVTSHRTSSPGRKRLFVTSHLSVSSSRSGSCVAAHKTNSSTYPVLPVTVDRCCLSFRYFLPDTWLVDSSSSSACNPVNSHFAKN